jgi:putative protease
MPSEPELLAPAGDWDCVRAAVANGADAVYFGLERFNARLRAHNFSEAELPAVVDFCHRHGVKTFVTFNTLVFTGELKAAADYLRLLNAAGVDALIVQDIGLVRLAAKITPELPIHASTQMTITSPEGAQMAREELGIGRIVLARELSLRELEKFRDGQGAELEVFVHGALCVAYSGQCLTSESLGQRSANRGECAQACRMPYQLVVDGAVQDLGDRQYLLSPQDLAAVREIPALLERGVVSFKIEGRLKSPEYVAAICQVYRKALDAALNREPWTPKAQDQYEMEMAFSRGLSTGWMHGVNHQELVPARFGKKRGALVGRIAEMAGDHVTLASLDTPVIPGDGLVFDQGGDTDREQGGRVYRVEGRRIYFGRGQVDFRRLQPGDRVWKTDDPHLNAELRKTFTGKIAARHEVALDARITGAEGAPMRLELIAGGVSAVAESSLRLERARNAPLTPERLREHLGKLTDTGYRLAGLDCAGLEGPLILPIAELNRLRRDAVSALDTARQKRRPEKAVSIAEALAEENPCAPSPLTAEPELTVLCRTTDQLEAALDAGIDRVLVDFEDIRRYRDAVQQVRAAGGARIYLATPRIQKAGEEGFFKLIANAAPDGVLIRNLGAIRFFADLGLARLGDFSLNVANPLTAAFFMRQGLEQVTVSYDLNISQVLDLLRAAPPAWFQLTIHQHMPMFHMEHCVFAAFMSEGKSFLDCGRPCEKHRVHLRDRVGIEHPLRADVGCRNTLYNAVAQTGAQFFAELMAAGLRSYRVELLEEDAAESRRVITAYQALLAGTESGADLWHHLRAQSQLGVTRGTY